ncbi:MAG: protein kinase [Planctomycetes bacterium]|nr:protein kinase [Planctomycetota bacterium]
MQIDPDLCDETALDALLADRLADLERVAVERHLESCVACRDRLERLAAAPALWAEAQVSLSTAADDARESGVASALGRETEGLRPEHILRFLSPTDDPHMLGRFGGYEISALIGCGGMGVVLKGLDVALDRYVAIKVLAPHLATSPAARLRFAREAQAAAAVVHDNVVAIHAVSEANGLPYLVMPYIRGASLQKRIDTQAPLATPEILRIGRQVAAGLAAAHAQGLVHRDIKPANILLDDGVERLKITDFGLARAADDASLTRSGVIAGTPQFMSPEQARGDAVDSRSDLFSLGTVLYTLCTGRPPFRAETSFGMLRRITDEEPRSIREINPGIPEFLEDIIRKLHAKDPADRFATATEVTQLFEQCLAHVQQPTTVPLPEMLRRQPAAPSVREQTTRHKTILGGTIALAVLVGVTTIAGLIQYALQGNSRSSSGDLSADPSVEAEAGRPGNDIASAKTTWNGDEDEALDLQIRQADEDVDFLAKTILEEGAESERSGPPEQGH